MMSYRETKEYGPLIVAHVISKVENNKQYAVSHPIPDITVGAIETRNRPNRSDLLLPAASGAGHQSLQIFNLLIVALFIIILHTLNFL